MYSVDVSRYISNSPVFKRDWLFCVRLIFSLLTKILNTLISNAILIVKLLCTRAYRFMLWLCAALYLLAEYYKGTSLVKMSANVLWNLFSGEDEFYIAIHLCSWVFNSLSNVNFPSSKSQLRLLKCCKINTK